MTPRARIFTSTELGWQRWYNRRGQNVYEKPNGALIAVPGSAEPQCTVIDYPFESFKQPWRGESQWVKNWKLDDKDKEMA